MIDIRVLGPVEARYAGRRLDLGRPRQRLVFAALALEPQRVVPIDVLIDRVWAEAPPERARHSLYVYIARLRRVLGDDVLMRYSGGYLLRVEPECVDAQRFLRLCERAREAGASGEGALLADALALWRGRPMEGLDGDWVTGVRQTFGRLRIDAAVSWGRAQLRAGHPDQVIGLLTALRDEHPLVEPAAAVHMLALHAAGRRAEALRLFADFRDRLADELGVDPGPELGKAHATILRAGDSPPTGPVPAQLPPSPMGFAGRENELAHLDSTDAGVVVISGTAGVGKTTLALHWAHRAASRYPDGQLYANLRGFEPHGPPSDPAQVVAGFLGALHIPAERIPVGFDAQVALFRSLLAGKHVLLVLDNARDSDQVRQLLPGSATCRSIVTSRSPLPGLVASGARLMTLDLFSASQARLMLAHRMGPARLQAEPSAVDEIVARCAGLPLALAIVAARAVTHPRQALAMLAEHLGSTLDGFSEGEPLVDIRAVFSWSYHAVSAGAAGLFRQMGLHPGPDLSLAAAASLAGASPAEVAPLLTELARAHLISEPAAGRYTFHDLLRAFARELAAAADERGCLARALDHYLHSAHGAALVLEPHRRMITLAPPVSGVTPEDLATRERAQAWFSEEQAVLLSAIEAAQAQGMDRHVWQLAWTLADFFQLQGHWAAWTATQQVALDAVRRLGDRAALATVCMNSARSFALMGGYDEAEARLREALALYGQLGDLVGEANAHRGLGWVFERQGRHEEAIREAESALARYQAAGHVGGQAYALNNLGSHHVQLGRCREAVALGERALRLHGEVGDRRGQADTLDTLGQAHHGCGEFAAAIDRYAEALALNRALGDRYHEADVLEHLGDAQRAAGLIEPAGRSLREALTILEELRHPDAQRIRAKLD